MTPDSLRGWPLPGLLGALLAPIAATTAQDYANLERRHLPAGAGTFAEYGAQLVDFDGDGDPDLLAGDALYPNLGAGRFGAPTTLLGGGPRAGANASADFNGDGNPDAIVTIGTQLRPFLGDGAGGFTAGAAVPSTGATNLRIADFDGDGNLDIVLRESFRVALFRGNGTGGFDRGATILQSGPLPPTDLEVFDFDGDGDVDLLMVADLGFGAGFSRIYDNDGTGNFAVRAGALPDRPASSAELSDLDGDGNVDIVLSTAAAPATGGVRRLWVLRGQGGTFVDVGAVGPATAQRYELFQLGDVTGDGFPDLLFFGYRAGTVFVGDGNFGFPVGQNTSIPEGTDELTAAMLADLDGDLDLDVVGSSVLRPHVLLNADQGRFLAGVTDGLPRARVFTQRAYVGDLDFGGPGSLLLLNSTGEGPVLFRPDRRGSYTRSTALPIFGKNASWALFEDLTGDGQDDVYIAFGAPGSSGGPGQDLFFRSSRGRLVDETFRALPAVVDTTIRVLAGDLNGDGRTDLLKRVSGGASEFVILLGQADRTFVTGGSVTGASNVMPSDLADMDLDGDVDLLTPQGVFLNDGAANFTPAGAGWPTFPAVTYEVLAEDFDGDGDDDLFVVRSGFSAGGGQDLLFENRAGQLVDVTFGSIPAAVDQSITARVADFDGDGDLDLYVNRNGGDKYLRNDGGLRFSARPLSLPSNGTFGVGIQAAGDFDGDGDIDALQGSRVAANLETQLHAPFLASLGARFELELFANGTFGGSTALVALGAISNFRQTVPGIQGTLWLDLPNSGEIARVNVPAAGRTNPTVVGVDIPVQPVFLGVEFVAQALYSSPAAGGTYRFSNPVFGVIQ